MLTLALILVSWLTVFALILRYGPDAIIALQALVGALTSLVKRVRQGNPDRQASEDVRAALARAMDVAAEVIRNLETRADLSNDEKHIQGYRDLQATLSGRYGITLSETDARWALQAKYGEMK